MTLWPALEVANGSLHPEAEAEDVQQENFCKFRIKMLFGTLKALHVGVHAVLCFDHELNWPREK